MGLNATQKKERAEYLERSLEITECSQRKPYVFISYASDNWEKVFKSAVVPLQEQYGLRVYADKAFDKVNDKWIVPMLRNVRGADIMIAFVSQSYIESYACFLELLTAVNNKKPIVFVSLGEQLHLGNTTDLPNVERGVKVEIMNQGGNIATNTNNTSNDVMRAMKSAYTSLSTLLEQDALSKYDISDAFINFFRDASINSKTINDLVALQGTISSVSQDVFDSLLISQSVHTVESSASERAARWQEFVSAAQPQPEPAPQAQPEPTPQAQPEPAPQPAPGPKMPGTDGPKTKGYENPGPQMPDAGPWQSNQQKTVPAPEAVGKAPKPSETSQQPKEKRKGDPAKRALILGILSIVFLFIQPLIGFSILCSIVGIVFGVKGLKSEKKGQAIIGLVLSGFVLLLFVVILAVY